MSKVLYATGDWNSKGFVLKETSMIEYRNEINVFQRSPAFGRLAEDNCPEVNFELNKHHYNKGYYLVNDIYLH